MVVAVVLGVPVAAQAGTVITDPADMASGVNILRSSASGQTFNIGKGQALMVSSPAGGSPITFDNCAFNLSDGTVRLSGDQDGISYNNGETVTKLFVSGDVTFNNCTFVTAEGAGKTTDAGYDAAVYFYGGNIYLNGCALTAKGYNGQFLGLYGSTGAVTFSDCDISTVNNRNGWSYAMYAGSVLKLTNGSTMTATGSSTETDNINAFYSGDNKKGYDAIFVEDSTIDFSDNAAGGFAINNVNIHVKNSSITVNDNKGNACNSGMWYLSDNSVLTMRGNREGHALSCIGIVAKDSTIDIQHNGYAGLFLQSTDSSFTKCTVDIACNGEKLLSYSAGDVWLNGHTLTVDSCTSKTQSGSAWLGGVGRKGTVKTAKGSSVVAYDLNSNAVDNLKSNTEPVLTDANIALNSESDKHTLFLNPFMESDYARGNAEKTASSNDADLFKDDKVKDDSDIIGGDNAKIGQLTDAQLSHHRYDWANGEITDKATPDAYGVMRYACVQACDDYVGRTDEHEHSFDCAGTYVYAPLVGITFDDNVDDDSVTGMPGAQSEIAYEGTVVEPTAPVRSSDNKDVKWVFTGWYVDAACTEKFDFSEGLTDNWTVVYAGWKQSHVDVNKWADPTDLTNVDETNVTLSIGATQDERDVAVLFVLDYSTSVDVRHAAADMLEELASKENTNVKACVINYWADQDAGQWVTIDSDTNVSELLNATQTGGTNIHGGLLKAQEMLSSDEIAGYETYLVTISDGITYLWTDEKTGETMSVWYQNRGNGPDDIQNANDVYTMKYGEGNEIPEQVFSELVNGEVTEKYNNTSSYFVEYGSAKPDSSETNRFLSYNNDDHETIKANYLIGNEIAIYKSAEVYRQLVGQVDHAFALEMDENHWDSYPYGKQLMDWMVSQSDGGMVTDDTAETVFAGITDEILYEIKSGVVTDIIGEDFDLADAGDISEETFTLKVGGEEQNASLDPTNGNKVYFGGQLENGDYPYSVEYKVEDKTETLVWTINVPVEQGNGLELSYDLTLVNRQTEPDTYTDIPTNESAVLEYVGTDRSEGTKEFPVPKVEYTVVGSVVVQPADITIYMGGTDGYESVVTDEDGTEVDAEKYDNSLPEPGFYLTLPDYLNDLIAGEDGYAGAHDLTGDSYSIRFYEQGTEKSWELKRYGASESVSDPDADGLEHFIYRIVPAKEEQDPIRLEFKDPDTNEHYVSDEFDPSEVGNLSNSYKMGIYAGQVDQSKILMDITAGGETHTLTVEVEPGTLSVRYVTGEQQDVVTDALDDISDAQAPGNRAYAVRGDGAKFYVNESGIDVTDDAAPSLLFDEVVSDHNTEGAGAYDETLGRNAIDILEDEGLESPQYQAKYLDLVDANNGNAWITTDKPVTVYWPRPEGTDEGTKFYLVHFEGLDREMSSDPEYIQQAIEDAVKSSDAVEIEGVVNDPTYGVKFTLRPDEDTNRVSFSPFVLVWDAATEPDPGPGPQPTTGSLKVTKAITGDLADEGDEFAFTVTLSGTSAASDVKTYGGVEFTDGVATITLRGGQSKTISGIPSGTKYAVEETDANGYKLADSSGTTGIISAGTTKTASFTNDKSAADTPEPATARFVARKVLNGAELKAGQFTFELRDADGRVVATATNDASGTIVFDGLTFDEAGTYEFTISEVNGGSEDYAYDSSVKGCYVVVTEEDGKLVAEAFAHDDLVFTNEYVGTEDPGEPDTPDTPDEPGEPTTPVTPGEDVPDTGDHTDGVLPAVLALGGAALVGGALVVARRRAM